MVHLCLPFDSWCGIYRHAAGDLARISVQVTIYRRLLIGRDGHLDQSEAYDISYGPQLAIYSIYNLRYIVGFGLVEMAI